jgi:hypothetical protein
VREQYCVLSFHEIVFGDADTAMIMRTTHTPLLPRLRFLAMFSPSSETDALKPARREISDGGFVR